MNAKQKFKKWYKNLPEGCKTELVYNFSVNPMTLRVCYIEIDAGTELGNKILGDLDFVDD